MLLRLLMIAYTRLFLCTGNHFATFKSLSTSSCTMQSRESQSVIQAPPSVLKSRFIIRTRSQVAARAAVNASRQPLQDTLTNSPVKEHRSENSFLSGMMEMDGTEPLIPIKKRSHSSPYGEGADANAISKKFRLGSVSPRKAHRTDSLNNPLSSGITNSTTHAPRFTPCTSQSATTTPMKQSSVTPTSNKDTPTLTMPSPIKLMSVSSVPPSPANVASIPIIDLFNPPTSKHKPKSPSKPFLYQRLSRPSASPARQVQSSMANTDTQVGNEASLTTFRRPLPALQLVPRVALLDESETPAPRIKPSAYRDNNINLASDDDATEVLESPSRKAKLESATTGTLPKVPVPGSSMIPQRITTATGAGNFKFKGPTLKPLNSSRVIASNKRVAGFSTRPAWNAGPGLQTKLNFPSLSRPTTKRSISSTLPAAAQPPRPSTSMDFSDQTSFNRRTSLHSSTQISLCNLESALEKLKVPRPRTRQSLPTGEAVDSSSQMICSSSSMIIPPPSEMTQWNGASTSEVVADSQSSGMSAPPISSALNTAPQSLQDCPQTTTAPLAFGDQRNRRASTASRSLMEQSSQPPTQLEPQTESTASTSKSVIPATSGDNTTKTRLKILKECVIYVDVRTDNGSDAGQLFINMLKGLGARVSNCFP